MSHSLQNALSDVPSTDAETAVLPAAPFHLATPAPLRPAITLGLGLPAQVNGMPAFYYWKDAIVVGSYVHPGRKFSLTVTREKLDQYASTFARMRANGVAVPILMDHAPTAAATLGWIVDVKRRGDRLLELHQFLGAEARDVGLRNFVSLGIDPDFIDGHGVRYGEAIVHSAVTPTPVVPGQDGFEAASAADVVTLSLEDAAEANPKPDIRNPKQIPTPDEETDLPVARVGEAAPQPHAEPAATPVAPSDADSTAVTGPMQLALSALADAAAAKRDLAVERGGVAPAVADELFALLVRSSDGVLNLMALSRGAAETSASSAPLALAVFDALARNHPVPLGETTQLQVLSRLIPGEDDDRAELRERMIALASARR